MRRFHFPLRTLLVAILSGLPSASFASGHISTLADCLSAASAFRSTCDTSAPAPAHVEHVPGVQIRSFDAESCPISFPNSEDTTVSGDACVWKHRLCVTCAISNVTGRVQIRVQSNGLPDHGYWSEATNPVEMNIDFIVDFDPPVTNISSTSSSAVYPPAEVVAPPRISSLAVTSAAALDAVLCSDTPSATLDANVPLDSHFSTVDASATNILSGVAVSGMPMGSTLTARRGTNTHNLVQDSHFPVDGSPPADIDTCLLHGTQDYQAAGARPLMYTTASPCMVGPRRHRRYQKKCDESNQCQGIVGEITSSFSAIGAASNRTIIGIAKDGHLIYGPTVDAATGTIVSGGTDICNGMLFDGHHGDGVLRSYGYQATTTFPYLVGCFGPASHPRASTTKPSCTTNAPASYISWRDRYYIAPEALTADPPVSSPLPPMITISIDDKADSAPGSACKDLKAMTYHNGVSVIREQINYPYIDFDVFFHKTFDYLPIVLSVELQYNPANIAVAVGVNKTHFAPAVYSISKERLTVRVKSLFGRSADFYQFQIAWKILVARSGDCTLRGGLEHARLGNMHMSQDLLLRINVPKVTVADQALECQTRSGNEFANSVTITSGAMYNKMEMGAFLNASMNISSAMPEITGNTFRDSLIVALSGKCSLSRLALRGGNGGRGAAIRVETGATLVLDTVVLRENIAPFSGGGIFVSTSSAATVTNSLFLQNMAAMTHVGYSRGGAVCNEGNLVVSDSTFLSNTASNTVSQAAGGALFNVGLAQVERSVFLNNKALGGMVGEGGAVATYRNGSQLELSHCVVSNNSATISGGAVFAQSALTMRHCKVEFNEAAVGAALRTTPETPEPLLVNVSMGSNVALMEHAQVDGIQEFLRPDNFRNGPW